MKAHQLLAAARLRDGTRLDEETFTPVDGDFDKVVVADKSDDGGRYVKNSMFDNGRPIRTEHMPTVWKRRPTKNPLCDVMSAYKGALLVSAAFREIVERLEPGVHQFLPVRIETSGRTVAEMFYFVVCRRLDALDAEACVPKLEDGQRVFPGARKPGEKRVFDGRRIAGCHVWHDARTLGRFISHEFRDACEAARLEGIDYGTPIDVSHL